MTTGPTPLGQRNRARGTQQQKLEQVESRRGHGSQQELSEEVQNGDSQTPLRLRKWRRGVAG